MPKYKFAEIVFNITDKKMPEPGDEDLYIGLEHLDSGSLRVTRWGSDVELVGQKLCMKKGDILFGRRNTYLRRAAIAPYDGIFSAHGMIFRPNTNVMDPDFFPFFISSDYFMDAAIRISVGSLSPTVNWKTLKELEFYLPDLEQQRKTSEILAAANETKEAYQDLLAKTDELVKSQFIELFGDPIKNDKKWPTYRFGDVATSRLGKMLDKKKQTGLYPKCYLANVNVQWFRFDLDSLNQMDFDEDDQIEFSLKDGDLLVCEGGEVGRCAIWHEELKDCYFQKAIHRVRCNKTMVLPEYIAHLFYYHSQINGFADVVGSKATIAHLPGDKLKEMRIFVPPITLQNDFINLTKQTDKSKFVAYQETIFIEKILKYTYNHTFRRKNNVH